MNKFWTLLLTVSMSAGAFAQTKAVTEYGEEIFLYNNGTWKYANASSVLIADESKPPKICTKPGNATFLYKSARYGYGIWLDPKKWSFKKEKNTVESAEVYLELKGEPAYALTIPEKLDMPSETLVEMALTNFREAAPDAEIVLRENRIVNGHPVVFLQMEGTVKSMHFVFLGYYYTASKKTIQFAAYTVFSQLSTYQKEIEELLNGFTILDKENKLD